ncbi:hypothetical protein QTG54_002930 [Skeletonema marinoi]|uniref:Uncharacterized protein n=1 Tax=Skeletonema marinoi TaxID=267567 RepID=A0AAD9DI08_9STRA|nr:hypothetical protein QTG54_002930 [Skeletonema marinoi]
MSSINNNPVEEDRPNNNDDDESNNMSTPMSASQHTTDEEPESHFMEGYTPLNFNMNDMVSMNDDSDGDETEMNDEEFAYNGYYHMSSRAGSTRFGDEHRATLELSSAHTATVDDTDTSSIPKDDEFVASSIPPPLTANTIEQVKSGETKQLQLI